MQIMVEVVIDSVRVSLTNHQRIVVLKEKNSDRYLPIWIGPYEAEAITISLQEVEVSRPQTHDLLRNILNTLNARMIRVEVVGLREDVFYASLIVEVNGEELKIDSRPSDALALAVRTHVPIFVAQEVMDSAAILPEIDVQEKETLETDLEVPTEDINMEEGESEQRLSVFEDFLKNLDDEDPSNPGSDDPDESGPEPDPEK